MAASGRPVAVWAVREQLLAEALSRVARDVPTEFRHAALVQIGGEKPPRGLAEEEENVSQLGQTWIGNYQLIGKRRNYKECVTVLQFWVGTTFNQSAAMKLPSEGWI